MSALSVGRSRKYFSVRTFLPSMRDMKYERAIKTVLL